MRGGAYSDIDPKDEDENNSPSDKLRLIDGSKKISTIVQRFSIIGMVIVLLMCVVALIEFPIVINELNNEATYTKNNDGGQPELIPISSDSADSTSSLKLFGRKESDELYLGIPSTLIDTKSYFLVVEQVTSGIGLSALYWDPGHVVSQDLFDFSRQSSADKIYMIAHEQQYRGNSATIQKSYTDSVMWEFDVITEHLDYIIVRVDSFAESPLGISQGKDLGTMLQTKFGPAYRYLFDSSRSFVNNSACQTNEYRTLFESKITYVLDESTPSVEPLSTTLPLFQKITYGARKTLLFLDAYNRASGAIDSSSLYHRRPYHPKSGFNSISFMNENTLISQRRQQLYMVRHHLVAEDQV